MVKKGVKISVELNCSFRSAAPKKEPVPTLLFNNKLAPGEIGGEVAVRVGGENSGDDVGGLVGGSWAHSAEANKKHALIFRLVLILYGRSTTQLLF